MAFEMSSPKNGGNLQFVCQISRPNPSSSVCRIERVMFELIFDQFGDLSFSNDLYLINRIRLCRFICIAGNVVKLIFILPGVDVMM
jgi:hypothetical protein